MTALLFAFRTNQSKYAFAGEAQLINAFATANCRSAAPVSECA